MPARGSRAQLIRDLSRSYACVLSNFEGRNIHPGELWGTYDHLNTTALKAHAEELAITPQPKGRPRGAPAIPKDKLIRDLRDLRHRRPNLSMRGLCRCLATRPSYAGMDPERLRKRYERSQRRPI